MNALFPISLGNNRFSSERTRCALRAIPSRYEEMVFVIADEIQIYNRCADQTEGIGSQVPWAALFGRPPQGLQRKAWLQRLLEEGNISAFERWRIIGFRDLADADFLSTLRGVQIAFETIEAFRGDIEQAAEKFCAARWPGSKSPVVRGLSRQYLLEEMAASICLHQHRDIRHEYYLGKTFRHVLRYYAGDYGFSLWAGAIRGKTETIFFEPVEEPAGMKWRQVLSA